MANLAPRSPRALVICTLRFSSNLGDGVIGDCLEHLVSRERPGQSITHFDMAGRTSFPVEEGDDGGLTKTIFYRCPPTLRPLLMLAAWPVIFRPRVLKAWQSTRPNEPFDLVFGGGQMLSDLALNFPLKFGFVARLAGAEGARMAVNAVGVSARWSATARRIFERALTNPLMRSWNVRDPQSRASLERHVPALSGRCAVTVDPGIWAGEVYDLGSGKARDGESLTIGLGVSAPSELAAYSRAPEKFSAESMLAYWTDIARKLVQDGHRPVLFTNGAEEDEAFVDSVVARLTVLGIDVARRPRARTPRQLADHMRELDGLISHRLHANVIAYSAGVPSVALVWDDKVRAFAEVAQRGRWCLDEGASAQETVGLVIDAVHVGVDLPHRETLKARALADVRSMLQALES